MDKKQNGMLVAMIIIIVAAVVLFVMEGIGFDNLSGKISDGFANNGLEQLQFGKNLDIWFMTFMVAFLMIFIRKFEWGVCLATLLAAASSFIVFLGVEQFVFDYTVWDQGILVRGAICAITYVIAAGVFLGTCKMWQYMLAGVVFGIVYAGVEYLIFNGIGDFLATDPGGSILVHMCAAYFGIGVALGIRDKRAFDEPMYTTTHSVTFVWLGTMMLWMLWPSFVTSLLGDPQLITWGTITCFMAGCGSIISTYLLCMFLEGKVNPLVYAYAMLAGPVAIGATLLVVGPWGALLIGLLAGVVSTLCFMYLHPWLCSKLGVLDVMGVHNLHGMAGWFGALMAALIVGQIDNLIFALLTVGITVAGGIVAGVLIKVTRGDMDVLCSDDPDFIKSEEPAA